MPDAAYFRLKARQCRDAAAATALPEVREQLTIFADELEAQADALEGMSSADTDGDDRC